MENMEEEVFIFNSPSKEVREEVSQGSIPAGIYNVQDKWCGDRWVTHYNWIQKVDETEEVPNEGIYFGGCDIGPNTQVYI